MNVGVNFFGPKFKLSQDFEGTLEILKQKGFTSVELCVAFDGNGEPPKELDLKIPPEVIAKMAGGIWSLDSAPQRLKIVRSYGFTVVSCHMMLGFQFTAERLLEMLPVMLEFGQANHISYFVISPMKGLAEVKTMVPIFKQVSNALAEVGITLLLHNHEMECMEEEGTTVLDYLLEQCPNMGLELDVGWAKFAGADPVALMRKYRDRIPLLHFKDVRADACAENRDTCFTAVGEGSIPLKEIMAQAKHCSIIEHGFIIDQDDSPTDILEDLGLGVKNICNAAE